MNINSISAIIFISQLVLISCQNQSLSSDIAEAPNSTDNICAHPSRYAGNYTVGDKRTLKTAEARVVETYFYTITPAEYQLRDGRHIGASIEYILIPAKYETQTSLVEVVVETCPPKEMGMFFDCDEVLKTGRKKVTRQKIVEPLRIEKCEVPFLYEGGKTRVVTQPSKVVKTIHTDFKVIE